MAPRTMRQLTLLSLVLGLLLVLGGCAKDDVTGRQADDRAKTDAPDEPAATVDEEEVEQGDAEATDLPLEELEDSGVTGTARIGPAKDGKVRIDIALDDAAGQTHGVEARLGSCSDALDQDPGEGVLDDATSYTLADIEDGQMRDDAKLPDKLVSEGTYTLLVYEGEEVEGDVAACVDIKVKD